MPFRPDLDNMLCRLVLIFLLLALCIGSGGYLFYDSQKKHLKKELRDELSAIADLKVSQIENWRKERITDAISITKATFFSAYIRQFLINPKSSGRKQDILAWMKSLQESYDYQSALIVDTEGVVRLSAVQKEQSLSSQAKSLVQEALHAKQAVLSDIHSGREDHAHLDLIAPLVIHKERSSVAVGALVIRVDPERFLYPLVRTWPTPSSTAETLLVKREANNVIYLNELRHRKNRALSFRLPISENQLPAAMAVRGHEGIVEGLDYRGVPVLAAIKAVPGLPWFLVAKVDTKEVYGPVRERAFSAALFAGVLIIASGMGVVAWWRRQNAEFYRKQYEAEIERRAMSQRYDFLSKYANDIIFLTDQRENIVEANDRAVTSYGYTRDELLRMSARDLRSPKTMDDVSKQMKQAGERDGFVFETVHKRKDRTTFPVEVSSRIIDAGGKSFFQSIVRDITERKQAEESLRGAVRKAQDERARAEAIVAAIGDILSIQDMDYRILYQNQVSKNIAGDHSGEYCYKAYENTDRVCEGCAVAMSFEDGRIHISERIVPADKGILYLEITASPLTDSSGKITAAIEIVRNVTERRRAEDKLKESEARLKEAQRLAHVGSWDWIVETDTVTWSEELYNIVGMDPKAPAPRYQQLSKIYTSESWARLDKTVRQTLETGKSYELALEIVRMDGTTRWSIANGEALRDNSGRVIRLHGTVQDITERRRAEELLKESENRYKRLIESATDYIYTVHVENGRPIGTSHGPGCVTVTGFSAEEYEAEPYLWHRMIHEEDRRTITDQATRVLSGIAGPPLEHRIIHKDGSIRWIRNTMVPRFDSEGRMVAYDGMISDVTERKQAEELLKESEERFRQVFEQNTDALFLFKMEDCRIMDANPAAVNLYGYLREEFIGNSLSLFIASRDEHEKFQRALNDPDGAGSVRIDHLITTKKNGAKVIVSIWGNIVRLKESRVLNCSFRDITEKLRLEEEKKLIQTKLIQANKMTSLGMLVSGVVHEINNPNQFISINAQLLAEIWEDLITILTEYYGNELDFSVSNIPFANLREVFPKLLTGISEGSHRIKDIVDNLKNYIRQDRSSLQGQVDIQKMISAATTILGNQIRKHTKNYNLILDKELPLIRGSAQQLEQVIINLIMNALQALPDSERGIWITASCDKQANQVVVRIKDDGVGMPAEVLERIPEPFFSTKLDHGGTGLGLSISYSIIKDHLGSLELESAPGEGTTVTIALPID